MFTGIIETIGRITAVEARGGDCHMVIEATGFFAGAVVGDSIATNGVCLTVVELSADHFAADLSVETLKATTAESWRVGQSVNLERALTPAKPLGGHLVSGHVDGVGRLLEIREDARSSRLTFETPKDLARYIARKGSITVDGISLTVNEVQDVAPLTAPSPAERERDLGRRPMAAGCRFGVNIVPHTLTHTTLGGLKVGATVNLEVDLIARYLERLLRARDEA